MSLIKKSQPQKAQAPQDLSALLAQLNAEDPADRRASARALQSHPAAIQPMLQRLEQEQDMAVRDALLTSLAEQEDPQVPASLVKHLRSEDVQLRNAVSEALAQLGALSKPALMSAVEDNDPDVRLFVVQLLSACLGEDASAPLCAVLERESDPNIVCAAIEQLGELGQAEAQAPIEAAMAKAPEQSFVRFTAQLALDRLRR